MTHPARIISLLAFPALLLAAAETPPPDAVMARLIRRAEAGEPAAAHLLAGRYAAGLGVPHDESLAAAWYAKAAMSGHPPSQRELATRLALGRGLPRNDAEAARWYAFAAQAGDAESAYALGIFHEVGRGVPKNPEAAAALLRQAAAAGHPDAMWRLGVYITENRAPALVENEARSLWKKAAAAGCAPAMLSLARLADDTRGPDRDSAEAFRLYRAAADAGNVEANRRLGMMLLAGDGVSPDPVAARRRFEKAGDREDAVSQLEYALLAIEAAPDPAADAKAARWLLAPAKAGDARARYALGVILRDGRGGVKRDGPLALAMFQGAAASGHAPAVYAIALLHQDGAEGLLRNDEQAAIWLRRAIDMRYPPALLHSQNIALLELKRRAQVGDPEAQYDLAMRLSTGDELVSRDDAEALRWWLAAAETGHLKSMMVAAESLLAGRGAPRNVQAAAGLYRRAAQQEYAPAYVALARIHLETPGVTKDPVEGARCIAAAAELGDANAQMWYAVILWNGEGTPANDIRSCAWLMLSLENGMPPDSKPALEINARLDPISKKLAAEKLPDLRLAVKNRIAAAKAAKEAKERR